MDMENILAVLIAERNKLDQAIAALQGGRRRGRPPGRRGPGRPPGKKADEAPRRRGMSAAARKAASARMTAFWAARRKQKAAAQKQAK